MVGIGHVHALFKTLADAGINVFLISQASVGELYNFCSKTEDAEWLLTY